MQGTRSRLLGFCFFFLKVRAKTDYTLLVLGIMYVFDIVRTGNKLVYYNWIIYFKLNGRFESGLLKLYAYGVYRDRIEKKKKKKHEECS